MKKTPKRRKQRKKLQKRTRMTLVDGQEMYSTWFGHDVNHFRPSYGAGKSVSQDRTKVNHPMKLGLNLH